MDGEKRENYVYLVKNQPIVPKMMQIKTQVMDGKAVAQGLREQLQIRVQSFTQAEGRAPGLAVVLVGEDPASQVYVSHKVKACAAVGIQSFEHRLDAKVSKAELKILIEKLSETVDVDGILVQLPLPQHLNEEEVLSWIPPIKDPDALTIENMGLMWVGRPRTQSCTPSGVMELLKYYKIPLEGRRAVVVGRSHIVGKPMAQLLLAANATVTICHSKTVNLADVTREADIVVVAAGRPEFLGREAFKQGAVVVDVGIHRKTIHGKMRLCGDVKTEELMGWASFITPVPGGVGPMTIAMLLENTFLLAQLHAGSGSEKTLLQRK